MVLAYDYPLLGVFWTMLIFFLWVAWLVVLFRVFADIFRSHQMGGFAKALWSIFVLFVPFLGVFIYLIVHGKDMTQRDIAEASSREAAFQPAFGGGSTSAISGSWSHRWTPTMASSASVPT